jgi:predicted phage tail protein
MSKVTRIVVLALLLAMFSLLAGCAPAGNELANAPDKNGIVAGFWRGLWNGVISPVTFIISLFNKNVHMYAVHNNGGWYNFGFLLGASIILGGSAGGGARARRRRD